LARLAIRQVKYQLEAHKKQRKK